MRAADDDAAGDAARAACGDQVAEIQIVDTEPGVRVTDAKALFDLLSRRSGNAGHCRRAQIDVAVIWVSARALHVKTFWVPGTAMIADPLTKRLGNSSLLRRVMQMAKYGLSRQSTGHLNDPLEDEKPNTT